MLGHWIGDKSLELQRAHAKKFTTVSLVIPMVAVSNLLLRTVHLEDDAWAGDVQYIRTSNGP